MHIYARFEAIEVRTDMVFDQLILFFYIVIFNKMLKIHAYCHKIFSDGIVQLMCSWRHNQLKAVEALIVALSNWEVSWNFFFRFDFDWSLYSSTICGDRKYCCYNWKVEIYGISFFLIFNQMMLLSLSLSYVISNSLNQYYQSLVIGT